MFCKSKNGGYKEVLEGIKLKPLVYGERTLFVEFRLERGSKLPKHRHPHEQTGYMVGGRMRLSLGEETFDVETGDSWCIPSNVEHGAEILEESIAVEVFSPVREDYLPENLG